MAHEGFRAGVGRVCITPPLTAIHAAWGAQVHTLPAGVETDLWATVLVAADSARTVALVDLDLVIISRDESEAIRQEVARHTGIPPEDVRVSVTHNHAGPPPSTWDWAADGGQELRQYYAILPALVGGAARLACQDLGAARLGVGNGESGVAVNRRETAPNGRLVTGVNPEGCTDPQVLVVRIDHEDGRPLAAIVGYTMHATTLGPGNQLISADWPGHMKRTVEAVTGATCLFIQGAAGNIGPGPEGFTDDVRVACKLGAQIGCEAARVFHEMSVPSVTFRHERIWESGASLGMWNASLADENPVVVRAATHNVHLPVRPQPSVAEAESSVSAAQHELQRLRDMNAPFTEVENAMFIAKRANMALSRARTYAGHDTFPVVLHLLQIGPAVLAGLEGEPFVETGLAVKERSPFPATWFGGYTGGWAGYIPTREEFARGGYEVETSPFAIDAAEVVIKDVVRALDELARTETLRGQ
jgi:hypothetical protein